MNAEKLIAFAERGISKLKNTNLQNLYRLGQEILYDIDQIEFTHEQEDRLNKLLDELDAAILALGGTL